jgi:hypothetical protein
MNIEIKPRDIVVSTFHTGTGFSIRPNAGVKILHIPSGVEVIATEGRSQHANKDIAFKLLTKHLEHYYKDALPTDTKPTIELTQKELRNRITEVLGTILNSRDVSLWDNWPGTQYLAEHVSRNLGDIVEFSKGKIKRGSKVKIVEGFSTGSVGIVDFVEPFSNADAKVWVTRTGASGPNCWLKHELELIE